MRQPSFRRALIAVLALALAVRLLVIAATPGFAPQTDAADYDRHAVALAQKGDYPQSVLAPAGGPTAFRPPGFPLVLAATYAVVGVEDAQARWEAGRVLQALLGTLAVGLLALIALRLWGRPAALVSAAIAAVYPPLVLVGSSLMAESLYIPLVLGAVLAALVHRDRPARRRWVALAGLLVGLAALTRSNGVAVLIPLALLVWTQRPRWSWRALRAPALLALAAALTLVPWTVRNAIVLDAFVPVSTQSGYALGGTYNDLARSGPPYRAFWLPPERAPALRPLFLDRTLLEPELSARLRARALDYVAEHPSYPFEVVARNTLRLLNLEGPGLERYVAPLEAYPTRLAVWSVYAFWVLALIAAAGAFTRAARRAPWALWLIPAAIAFSSVFFLGLTRYRSPADPFLVMLAALALLAGWRRLRPALPSPG